jgi:hypothetical protein
MSLSGIATSAIAKVEQLTKTDVDSNGSVGSATFGAGSTAAGAYMAQGITEGGGAPGEPSGGSLVKKMLVGTAVGAGLGLGATFLVPGLREVTMFGVGGWAAKGIIAAIGGAVGAVGAAALHFIGKAKQNLAMQAQAQAAQQNAMQPTNVAGPALVNNSRGKFARDLQSNLATLGIYKGKLTQKYDAATQAAVRRYEVMKGVQPTGQATPELRAAVAQDVALVKQYA